MYHPDFAYRRRHDSLARSFRTSAGPNPDGPPEQTPGRRGSYLRAPARYWARGLHVHAASWQRPGQQLDRTHRLDGCENAIEAAHNRFVVAINKIPITKGIPYHSIIGDRGRGNSPNSSDGVVAYWSSHLDGAG